MTRGGGGGGRVTPVRDCGPVDLICVKLRVHIRIGEISRESCPGSGTGLALRERASRRRWQTRDRLGTRVDARSGGLCLCEISLGERCRSV